MDPHGTQIYSFTYRYIFKVTLVGRTLYVKICKLGEAFMCFLITSGHLNTPKCFNVSLYLPCFYFSRSSGYIYTSTQQKAGESLQHWTPDGPHYPTAWWLPPWLTHVRLSQYSSLQGFLRKQTCTRLHEIFLSPTSTACQYYPHMTP